MNDTVSFFYLITKSDLFFINNVMEAMEGMAMVHTVNPSENLIEFLVPPGTENEFLDIMNEFTECEKAIPFTGKIKPFTDRRRENHA